MWPKVITFDCYGTLVRWPQVLRSFFDELVFPNEDGADFHKDFTAFHVHYKSLPYQPYSEVLGLALAATMKKWNLPNIAKATADLLNKIRVIPPYEDVVPVLSSLATKYRIAILSNTEDDLIAGTIEQLGVRCDVITAEQAQAYKPDHQLFFHAYKHLGVVSTDVLHVGAGWATDMVPAYELGLTRIWINRRHETAEPLKQPSAELSDFQSLEAIIDKLSADRLL